MSENSGSWPGLKVRGRVRPNLRNLNNISRVWFWSEEANCDRSGIDMPEREVDMVFSARQVVRKAVNRSIDWDPKSVAAPNSGFFQFDKWDPQLPTVSCYPISTALFPCMGIMRRTNLNNFSPFAGWQFQNLRKHFSLSLSQLYDRVRTLCVSVCVC